MSEADGFAKVHENSFYLVSGMGYPDYLSIIENAILDINSIGKFDRLVISIDSENMTRQEKYDEIHTFVLHKPCIAEIRIVVQHFCFEVWALGNRKIVRPHPASSRLHEYKQLFDVRRRDPELLPHKPDENLNRAQFAEKYLRLALNDNSGISHIQRAIHKLSCMINTLHRSKTDSEIQDI